MKTPFEQAFAAYWREVRAVCPPFLRRRLLRDLRGQARLLQREEPTCDVAALRERLGDPTEVVSAYEEEYYADGERGNCERHSFVNGIISVLLLIVLIVEITVLAIHISNAYKEERIVYVFTDFEEASL